MTPQFSKAQQFAVAEGIIPPEHTTRSLTPNSSIVDLAGEEIDESQNLLGRRWLSRGSAAIVCAPSGIGKSTMSTQSAASWSVGKVDFGIKPAGALRILTVQSEDDRNDMREMSKVIHEMIDAGKLCPDDLPLIRANTHIEWANDLVGDTFIDQLDDWLKAQPRDLVIINPFMSFAGIDMVDQSAMTHFLRAKLNPLLAKHGCGALLMHHSGKLLGESEKRREWWEYMYLLFGSSELTNWARAIVFIRPSPNPGVFEFISAKRFDKIGWTDRSYFFSHSANGKLLWVATPKEEAESVAEGRKPRAKRYVAPEAILKLFKPTEKLPASKIIDRVKKHLDKGRDWTRENIRDFVMEGKLVQSEEPNPKGQPFVYYHLPTVLEPAQRDEDGNVVEFEPDPPTDDRPPDPPR